CFSIIAFHGVSSKWVEFLFYFQSTDGRNGAAFYLKALGGGTTLLVKHINIATFFGGNAYVGGFAIHFRIVVIGYLHDIGRIRSSGYPFEGPGIQIHNAKPVAGSIGGFLIQKDDQRFTFTQIGLVGYMVSSGYIFHI